jgi:hypothetical protein
MKILMTANRAPSPLFLARWLALVWLALAGAGALAQSDPPARVASLSHLEGSVVLAPAGDTEWTDAVLNRPVTRGDRLWTDRGARAEVHLGSAVLHLDDETFLDITALDDLALQASLNEGTVNARVRQLDPGENFEIDTPHLAFRAAQPGDYRVDVDPASGTTQVRVRSGAAIVFGAGGQAQQLQAGEQVAFTGRNLERVAMQPSPDDDFDRWADERNRREDESIAARYVPREVVGYQQLDPYGSWADDPAYGAVWFPTITQADWAPYRYGRWDWIAPWGWTWIDEAPWGFAPFHYGRWAHIGSRWAWVPGRIGRRPVYSPALVAFVGGAGAKGSWNLSIGSSSGIAWYPLAPGEAWRPAYRASPLYLRNANRNIVLNGQAPDSGRRRLSEGVTAMRVEDFSRGRPVGRNWARVNPAEIARAPAAGTPALPPPPRFDEGGRTARSGTQPPARIAPPAAAGRPQPQFAAPGPDQGVRGRPGGVRPDAGRRQIPQPRAGDPQRPLMQAPPPAERAAPARQQSERQDEQRLRDDSRHQRLQSQQQQENVRRDQQSQQRAAQQQQEQQRRAQRAEVQRQQASRQQQRAIQQQQRAQQPPQPAAPPAVQPAAPQPGQARERGVGRPSPDYGGRSQAGDEGRGRGPGHGRGD